MTLKTAVIVGLLSLLFPAEVLSSNCECPWALQSADLKQLIASSALGNLDQELASKLAGSDVEAIRAVAITVIKDNQAKLLNGKQSEPRMLWFERPREDELTQKWSRIPAIIVGGDVTESGFFRNLHLMQSTGNHELDRLVLRSAACAIFLPKVFDGRATAAQASLVVRWPIVGGPPLEKTDRIPVPW